MIRDIETEKNRAEYVNRWLEKQVTDRPEVPRRPVLPLHSRSIGAAAPREPRPLLHGRENGTDVRDDDFVNLLPKEDYFVFAEPQPQWNGAVEEGEAPAVFPPPAQRMPVYSPVENFGPSSHMDQHRTAGCPFGGLTISNNPFRPSTDSFRNFVAILPQSINPPFIPYLGPFNIPPPPLPINGIMGRAPSAQICANTAGPSMSADDFRRTQTDWAMQLQQRPSATSGFFAAIDAAGTSNPIAGSTAGDAVRQNQNQLDYLPVEANGEDFRNGHFVNPRRNRISEIRIAPSQIPFAHMSIDEIMKDRHFMDEFPVIEWIPSEEGCKSCIPCMEDFQVGESVRLLPCFHRFHQKCIDHWFSQNQYRCPHCRWPLAENRLMPQVLEFKNESAQIFR